jgi:predicted PurR-regulated permease PerM
METEEKAKDKDGQAEEQVQTGGRQDDQKVNSTACLERSVARLKNGIWILAVFTALICALGIVNMMIAKKAFEGVQRHLALIGELSESLKEIQRTTAQLKKKIEELSDTEEEGNQGDASQIWEGKI